MYSLIFAMDTKVYRKLLLSLIFLIPFHSKRKNSQNAPHIRRITVSLRLHRTAGNHLSPMVCSGKVKNKVYSGHCPVLNVSRNRDSTTSLDEQFQYLAILTVEKSSLTFKQNFLYFSWRPMTLVHMLNITQQIPAPSLLSMMRYL